MKSLRKILSEAAPELKKKKLKKQIRGKPGKPGEKGSFYQGKPDLPMPQKDGPPERPEGPEMEPEEPEMSMGPETDEPEPEAQMGTRSEKYRKLFTQAWAEEVASRSVSQKQDAVLGLLKELGVMEDGTINSTFLSQLNKEIMQPGGNLGGASQ